MEKLKIIWKSEFEKNIFKKGFWEIIFKSQIRKPRMPHGPKVALQTMQQMVWSRWQTDSWVILFDKQLAVVVCIHIDDTQTWSVDFILHWRHQMTCFMVPLSLTEKVNCRVACDVKPRWVTSTWAPLRAFLIFTLSDQLMVETKHPDSEVVSQNQWQVRAQ